MLWPALVDAAAAVAAAVAVVATTTASADEDDDPMTCHCVRNTSNGATNTLDTAPDDIPAIKLP